MDTVEKAILTAMVTLVRKVPWGENRPQLELKADRLDADGSFESGWDNYSTAANLWWQAELYRFAAQARFPRQGDTIVQSMKEKLFDRLLHEISLGDDDLDVGEATRNNRSELSAALSHGLTADAIDEIVDELVAGGFLQVDAEQLKQMHRNAGVAADGQADIEFSTGFASIGIN